MKIIINVLCCIFIISIISGCSEKKMETTTEIIKIDYKNEISSDSSLTTNYFKNRRLIKLETNDESLISTINRLIVFENNYFIFDENTQSIYKFNKVGKYISKIHRIGHGPGEYVNIIDFTIDIKKKQIIVLSNKPNALIYFDLDFNFLKQIKNKKAEYYKYISIDQSSIYLTNLLDNGNYVSINSGSNHSEFLPIENFIKKKRSYSLHPNIIKSDYTYFFKVYDNIVYELIDNSVLPKYQIEFGDNTIKKSFIEENELRTIIQTCFEKKLIYRITDFRECNNYLTFGMGTGHKIVIYSKKEKISELFSHFYDPETGLYLSKIIGYDGPGDKMMFIVRARSFIGSVLHNKNADKLKQNKTYTQYKEIANKLTPTDNPILMIYSLK